LLNARFHFISIFLRNVAGVQANGILGFEKWSLGARFLAARPREGTAEPLVAG
jgi:hypothetical protein